VEKAHTEYRGKPTPARAKLAFFPFGKIAFELIEPIGGPSTWKEALDKHGEGVHHVAFRVDDMDRALAALNKKGFETIQTGDFTGGRYAYVDTTRALRTVVELLAVTQE
jgi:4-hydroxyphenylpyruvate dioxygenase-like putative hemolysin